MTGPIELGDNGDLFPIYLRGEAYLMLRDGNAAAAEFQKFIDHRGRVGTFPGVHWRACNSPERALCREIRPRQRLPTRISLRSGETPSPDIPILKQAKLEYAKLP